MGVTLVDSTQVIWEFLTATGTSLYTAVSTRVWDREFPASFKNTQKALVFMAQETVERNNDDQICSVIIKHFGGSNKRSDARSLARLTFERLDSQRGSVASGEITLAKCLIFDMGPFVDPLTGWPNHLSKYEVRLT